MGEDFLADIWLLRAEPALFGRVASDPTVSRLIDASAATPEASLAAINNARAKVRARMWKLAGEDAPDHQVGKDRPLVVDLDGTLITARPLRKNRPRQHSSGASGFTRWDRGWAKP